MKIICVQGELRDLNMILFKFILIKFIQMKVMKKIFYILEIMYLVHKY